jgi:phage tail sheath gpL-like
MEDRMPGIPSNVVEPIFAIDFDSSRSGAGNFEFPVQLLCIGQKLSTGEQDSEIPLVLRNEFEVGKAFGYGSQIHLMSKKIFLNSTTIPIVFIALDDLPSGNTAATNVITFSGTATENGYLVIYIGGRRYSVSVAVGDTAAVACTALYNLLYLDLANLPCTLTDNTTGTLTLTAKNKGVSAGDLNVRFNYNIGEATPSGLSHAIVYTAGTGDPDVDDALAVLDDDWYPVIVSAYDDATNMGKVEAAMLARADILTRKEGVCFYAKRDTIANMVTFATNASRNSQYSSLFPAYNRCESTFELSAGIAAAVAQSIVSDSAQPLKSIKLNGFLTLEKSDRVIFSDRNYLAQNGVSTITDYSGVQTSSMITMYRLNESGAPDNSYKQLNTMFTLLDTRYQLEVQITTKYSRAKLGATTEGLDPGQQIMTPSIGRAEAIIWFRRMVRQGKFENLLDRFIELLEVTRDDTNVNRLNFSLPPNLMNQFLVGSGTMYFEQ